LLIIVIGFTSNSNGQDESQVSIDAGTNKSFYDYGDMIIVSGKIKNYDVNVHSDITLTFHVTDPMGDNITMGQATPNS